MDTSWVDQYCILGHGMGDSKGILFAKACKASFFMACVLLWGDGVEGHYSFHEFRPSHVTLLLLEEGDIQ